MDSEDWGKGLQTSEIRSVARTAFLVEMAGLPCGTTAIHRVALRLDATNPDDTRVTSNNARIIPDVSEPAVLPQLTPFSSPFRSRATPTSRPRTLARPLSLLHQAREVVRQRFVLRLPTVGRRNPAPLSTYPTFLPRRPDTTTVPIPNGLPLAYSSRDFLGIYLDPAYVDVVWTGLVGQT